MERLDELRVVQIPRVVLVQQGEDAFLNIQKDTQQIDMYIYIYICIYIIVYDLAAPSLSLSYMYNA